MLKIDFPEWREVLAQAELPEGPKRSFEIPNRSYLSRRCPAQVVWDDGRPIASRPDASHFRPRF